MAEYVDVVITNDASVYILDDHGQEIDNPFLVIDNEHETTVRIQHNDVEQL